MVSDQAVLRKIEQQPRQSAAYKQLVRELGIGGEERRPFGEQLDRLVRRGELVRLPEDRYAIPARAAKSNQVEGRLSMHRDGYGFVVPESGALRQQIQGDIYVGPHAVGNAMHGDRVLVEVGAIRADGRAEGRILRVIGRAHLTIVGTFHYGSRSNCVTPIDEKITQDIVIPRGMEIPSAGEASAPVSRDRVLGKEARRKPVGAQDLEGVVVDVEITSWPTPVEPPRGRVVEILGYPDDFGVDVEIVIRKYHIPHRFSGEVLEEAQAVSEIIPGRELAGRRDFRRLPIVTIDGETARDFDDAVTVRRLPNGSFELQVHIADVAHYVVEDSALDQEARLRGTSVYFPDRAVPMLPIELSTNICSLRPQVERLVMSCVMEIDHRGEVVGFELSPGVIRSAERMTYTDVNAILEGDAVLRQRYQGLVEMFELAGELAQVLNRKRVRRGSIDFDLPEPVIEFDELGLMKAITRSERNQAHRLIEEFMLSANECVASYLEAKVDSLYRIHEKPDPKRVLDFETVAAAFGYSLGVGALPVKKFRYTDERRPRQGGGTRAGQQWREIEIPQDIHITPRMYQKLAAKIAGKPEERILSYLMLRSLKQARYSEDNEGHFALAASTYTHFTSPIRRYPDLIVHRILKQVLNDSAEAWEPGIAAHGAPEGRGVPVGRGVPPGSEEPQPWSKRVEAAAGSSPWAKGSPKGARAEASGVSPAKRKHVKKGLSGPEDGGSKGGPLPLEVLHQIAEESSQTERRADDAERELMDWKKVKFMEGRLGEEFEGLIVSVTKFGLFVELMELFIEGLVPISTLTDDRYTYRENTRQIIGQHGRKTYSLGDKVQVLVDRVDPVQHKIQFALVEEAPSRAQKRHRRLN